MIAERLAAAMNAHDVDAFAACFASDYDSVQPAHPDRAFTGKEQVRKNWTEVFAGVPDFRAELAGASADGDTLWTEWRWTGTGLEMAGVIIFGIRGGLIASARLYVENVEHGEGIEGAVREMTEG
jgi:hypothetical protein